MPAVGDVARGFGPVTVGQDIPQLKGQFPRAIRFAKAFATATLIDTEGGTTLFNLINAGEVIEGATRQVSAVTGAAAAAGDIVALY
jgi:hypothetical protein